MSAQPSITTRRPRTSHTRYRLLTVAVGLVAGVVVWIVAALAGAPLSVTSPLVGTIVISLPLVIGTSIVLGFAAWGVLALLERKARNAGRIWTAIAVVVLVVSVLSVYFLDGTVGTKVSLGIMHLAVGLPLTLMLPRGARDLAASPKGRRL
nr:DUF6069 family protein [Microbacterium bovistercoris]